MDRGDVAKEGEGEMERRAYREKVGAFPWP